MNRLPNRLGIQGKQFRIDELAVQRVNGMAEHDRLEQFGWEHFLREHRRLKQCLPDLCADERVTNWSPCGPEFDYSRGSALFSGRRGSGPLLIALDTNQVIDYLLHGSNMWKGLPYDDETDDNYIAELDALSLILALLVVRDVRLIILPETLLDARTRLGGDRYRARRAALDEFEYAANHFADQDEDLDASRHGALVLPDSMLTEALQHIPAALDRMMVRAAAHSGAHVFMTRDTKVVKARKYFRPFGLYLGTPGDVLEELIGAGALNCLFEPRLLSWPLPDQHRIGHLIHAMVEHDL